MLPMLPSTMPVGAVSYADVPLEQMLAAVPDLDALVPGCAIPSPPAAGPPPMACRTGRIRFESVAYRYPGGPPVFEAWIWT